MAEPDIGKHTVGPYHPLLIFLSSRWNQDMLKKDVTKAETVKNKPWLTNEGTI